MLDCALFVLARSGGGGRTRYTVHGSLHARIKDLRTLVHIMKLLRVTMMMHVCDVWDSFLHFAMRVC
jgi:hypothetical protein